MRIGEPSKVYVQAAAYPIVAQHREIMSPRLLEAALTAFSRWLDTYVAPEEALPLPCERLRQPINDVLPRAVQSVAACLRWYPHETDLHSVAIRKLLHCVVNRPRRCAHFIQLPEWAELCNAAAGSGADAPLATVHSKLQRRLLATLCGAVARTPAGARVQEGNGHRGAEADAAAARSEAFLQHLLGPSLALVAQFADAEGQERRVGVAAAAGQASLVRHSHMQLASNPVDVAFSGIWRLWQTARRSCNRSRAYLVGVGQHLSPESLEVTICKRGCRWTRSSWRWSACAARCKACCTTRAASYSPCSRRACRRC